jgi:Rad51
LTEVYGPPGVGKTALAMQLASNALYAGNEVVWIDTGAPLPGPRFEEILKSYNIPGGQDPPSSPPIPRSTEELLEKLRYFNVHTLPHLLVLFLHPTAKFPPDKTALIIIDNVSAPFATAFPRILDSKVSTLDLARKNKLQWAANRKWSVAGDCAAAMSKMAALKNVAILAINQVATSLKGVRRAVLKPAISGTAWEAAIHNRVVLWRDVAPAGSVFDQSIARSMRFAEVVKAGGRAKRVSAEGAVSFVIEKAWLFLKGDRSYLLTLLTRRVCEKSTWPFLHLLRYSCRSSKPRHQSSARQTKSLTAKKKATSSDQMTILENLTTNFSMKQHYMRVGMTKPEGMSLESALLVLGELLP